MPFAPAAVVLAVFAVAGVAVVDDFGVSWDEAVSRTYAPRVLDYVLEGRPLPNYFGRYYGVAFEMPLLLVERLLGLTDSRAIHLTRHLLIHLFFLTGGWFCYLLAYRLFGDRYLALFALLLFLLHPRLYAHSFYNDRDIPFLAAFMIALYLLERACRRGSAAAFAACGVGVGALVNLRIMGVLLFAAALGLRALDLLQARGPAARRRVLAGAAAFVLAAAGTLYAISPYLWLDPLAIVDAFAALNRTPYHPTMLFQGEPVRWPWLPPHYLPTWMAITTPPATLLLSLIGVAAAVRAGIVNPRSVAANTGVRFAWLLIACLALPLAAVVAARSSIYNGWRHVYFLYAPWCLLAVYGLRALLAAARRLAARLPRGIGLLRRHLAARGVYALAAAALAGAAVDAVRLHPYQQTYFNFLVDRRTPEYLRTQYRMLYWGTEFREALEYLLARFPGATLHVDSDNHLPLSLNRLILPAEERRRIVIADAEHSPHFFIHRKTFRDDSLAPVLHRLRIYRNTVLMVTAVDLSLVDDGEAADGFHAAYRAAVAGEPLIRSDFDLYLDGGTLTYVKEACGPEDTAHRFLLQAVPASVEDLPLIYRQAGSRPLDFRFGRFGVRLDGRCLIRRPLPDYPLRALEVARRLEPHNLRLLEAVIDLTAAQPPVSLGRYWSAHAAIAAGERGPPAGRAAPTGGAAPTGRAGFDLYLDAAGAELIYHKEPCAPEDLRGRFYLHVFPADPAELAAGERQAGFSNRGFTFAEHGVLLRGGACVALVPLPAYEHGAARLRTGQFIIDGDGLWQAEIRGDLDRYRQAHAAIAAGERGAPAARGAFDLYLDAAGAELVYHKEPCAPADLRERFFLHLFPADASELADDERDGGFYNRSFDWAEHGARLEMPDAQADAACVALVPLPVYEGGIAHVRAGQFNGWIVEFPAGE